MNRLGKIAIVAVAAAFSSGLSAQAADRHIAVHFSDLNLSRPADAHTLLTRLEVAANRVCGGGHWMMDLHAQAIHDACMKDAMDHAVASIRSPLVVALYNNKAQAYQVAGR